MKKILIIGSNSFAGSNFTDYLLDKNFKVYGVSRSKEIKKEHLSYKKNKKLKNFKFFRINLKICTFFDINISKSKSIFLSKLFKSIIIYIFIFF